MEGVGRIKNKPFSRRKKRKGEEKRREEEVEGVKEYVSRNTEFIITNIIYHNNNIRINIKHVIRKKPLNKPRNPAQYYYQRRKELTRE